MGKGTDERIRLEFYRNIFTQEMEFALVKRSPGGTQIAKLTWEDFESGTMYKPAEPTFTVPYIRSNDVELPHFFQQLISNMNQEGILNKDPNFKMLEGELKAKNEHLTDMRRLVFEEPKVEITHDASTINVNDIKN